MTLCQTPKAVYPTLYWWIGSEDNWMCSIKLPLLKAVGGAATQCTPGICHGPITRMTHMPAMGYTTNGSWWCCKPSIGWDLHWSLWQPHGNLKAEIDYHNKQQTYDIWISGRLSSEKEALTCRGPMALLAYAWEEASGIEVVTAVAKWCRPNKILHCVPQN